MSSPTSESGDDRVLFAGIIRWPCPQCFYDNATSTTDRDGSTRVTCLHCHESFIIRSHVAKDEGRR